MAVYIVTGVHGVGKGAVTHKALEMKPDAKLVVFGDIMFEIAKREGLVKDKDELRSKIPFKRYKNIQQEAATRIAAMEGDIIVDTHCSIKMRNGYYPGLPHSVLRVLKPKAIVLIEADADEISRRREEDKTRMRADFGGVEDTLEHQEINRTYAVAYAVLSGAMMRVIRNNQGKVDEAAKKLVEMFRNGGKGGR